MGGKRKRKEKAAQGIARGEGMKQERRADQGHVSTLGFPSPPRRAHIGEYMLPKARPKEALLWNRARLNA